MRGTANKTSMTYKREIAAVLNQDNLHTTATAGIPGVFSGGEDIPYEFADLAGVTASPLTAWTVGQYVELGDGSRAYWDSAAWAVGEAPA